MLMLTGKSSPSPWHSLSKINKINSCIVRTKSFVRKLWFESPFARRFLCDLCNVRFSFSRCLRTNLSRHFTQRTRKRQREISEQSSRSVQSRFFAKGSTPKSSLKAQSSRTFLVISEFLCTSNPDSFIIIVCIYLHAYLISFHFTVIFRFTEPWLSVV